jgi:hypothetical protein
MPPRKQNGVADDGRVSVNREEYAALVALKEVSETRLVEEERLRARIHDLDVTCRAQARRLVEVDLATQHLERVNGLQRCFIDLLRADRPAVASLEDLSTFWRAWFITTENLVKREPKLREEVSRLEPDLFKSWRIWVRDAGQGSRTFAVAGATRAEVDGDRLALSQAAFQDRILEQQRAQTAALSARVKELEGEVEAYRCAVKGKTS